MVISPSDTDSPYIYNFTITYCRQSKVVINILEASLLKIRLLDPFSCE